MKKLQASDQSYIHGLSRLLHHDKWRHSCRVHLCVRYASCLLRAKQIYASTGSARESPTAPFDVTYSIARHPILFITSVV